MSGATGSRSTRSSGPVFDLESAFPMMRIYMPSTMLPTLASVVGMLRFKPIIIYYMVHIIEEEKKIENFFYESFLRV